MADHLKKILLQCSLSLAERQIKIKRFYLVSFFVKLCQCRKNVVLNWLPINHTRACVSLRFIQRLRKVLAEKQKFYAKSTEKDHITRSCLYLQRLRHAGSSFPRSHYVSWSWPHPEIRSEQQASKHHCNSIGSILNMINAFRFHPAKVNMLCIHSEYNGDV